MSPEHRANFQTRCLRRPNGRPSRLQRIRAADRSSDADLGFIGVSAVLLCRSILRRNGFPRVGSVPSSAVLPKRLPKGAFGWFSAYPSLRLPRQSCQITGFMENEASTSEGDRTLVFIGLAPLSAEFVRK